MDETFKVHAMPFSGEQGDGSQSEGQPKKSLTERKTDKTASNNNPRSGMKTGKSATSTK